jgi:NAD(P) transhydrogenase
MTERELYGQSYRVKSDITMSDLRERTSRVIAREVDVIRNQLQRNRVELAQGSARFVDQHTVSSLNPAHCHKAVIRRRKRIGKSDCRFGVTDVCDILLQDNFVGR